mgnify:CR=1 FL=1
MSLDVLFFVVFRRGLPGWPFEAGAPFRSNIGDEKIPRKLLWFPGLSFLSQRLLAFARPAADFRLFYSLWNGVGNLEHRHILLSARAVENGLVVAVEVHHGS